MQIQCKNPKWWVMTEAEPGFFVKEEVPNLWVVSIVLRELCLNLYITSESATHILKFYLEGANFHINQVLFGGGRGSTD